MAKPKKIKKIAVMTTGGDCPGLNSAIRAVVLAAYHQNIQVIGVKNGTEGLMARPLDVDILAPKDMDSALMRTGGTFLGTTNRGNPFSVALPEYKGVDHQIDLMTKGLKKMKVDGMVIIGGDGSFAALRQLGEMVDIPYVGIPKTIDNDVNHTVASIGFKTAVTVATEAMDRLVATAKSHNRVMILEVMGRGAGHIALHSGVAAGADIVLIPEVPYTFGKLKKKLLDLRAQGRKHALMVVSEAVLTDDGEEIKDIATSGDRRHFGGIGRYFAKRITEDVPWDSRVTALGHLQRGADPGASDRLIASMMGEEAVTALINGQSDMFTAWTGKDIKMIPMIKAIKTYANVKSNDPVLAAARRLGIYMGD